MLRPGGFSVVAPYTHRSCTHRTVVVQHIWSARARNIVASRLLVRSTHPWSIRVMLMHDDFDVLVPQPVGGLLLYPPIATNQRCLHSSHTPTPTMVLGRIQAPRSRVTWSPARGRHQPIAGLQLHDPIHRQVASSEGFWGTPPFGSQGRRVCFLARGRSRALLLAQWYGFSALGALVLYAWYGTNTGR